MELEHLNSPKEQASKPASGRAPQRPIDPALARRNRWTAVFLVLLALVSLLAFLANFGIFQ